MKKSFIFAAMLLAAHLVTAGEWLTDLPKAQEQAKKDNKLVLLDFTGSDWCGWCIKFKKEVLDTDEFKGYADKNLVLVEVDFPNKKEQSEDLKKANQALKEKYSVSGYPTYVVLNGEGKEVGRQVGYEAGGPKAFIAKLDGFKKK
jgi:protein disulfide-isomerase